MMFPRLRTTAAILAGAGLGLAAWAQGSPPHVAPPTSAISSPDTPPATRGSSNADTPPAKDASGTPRTGTNGTPAGTAPGTAGQAAPQATDSKPAHADAAFMDDAAHAGHYEVEAAQLALKKGQSDAVKSFAKRMVDDHTAASQQLASLAAAKNHKLPDGPSLIQKGKLKLLGTRDGANFDKSYSDSLGPKAHEETIALFEKASSKAHDPDVKAFADKTLPTLREHLKMAQELDRSMNGADGKNVTRDAPLHNDMKDNRNK